MYKDIKNYPEKLIKAKDWLKKYRKTVKRLEKCKYEIINTKHRDLGGDEQYYNINYTPLNSNYVETSVINTNISPSKKYIKFNVKSLTSLLKSNEKDKFTFKFSYYKKQPCSKCFKYKVEKCKNCNDISKTSDNTENIKTNTESWRKETNWIAFT